MNTLTGLMVQMSNNSTRILYLPSTPLNVLVSCAVALHNQSQADEVIQELWLIDQKDSASNPYMDAMLAWSDSPFKEIKLFKASSQEKSKLQHRKLLFKELKQFISIFQPEFIGVGSDRRVEFQYVMSLNSNGKTVQGWYLDDGLYSYAGRPYHCLKDNLNGWLKKLFYGTWWQEPKTVGASGWINKAWLFLPEKAVAALQEKEQVKLQPSWFKVPEIISLSSLLADQLDFDLKKLVDVDVVLLLPHPNNIKKMPGYVGRIQEVVEKLHRQGKTVAVKYHPRAQVVDELGLKQKGVSHIIPSQLAFEFCLPSLSQNCIVVGDVGTALLSSKWLRPDVNVYAVLDEQDEFQNKFISLTQTMGINVIDQIEEVY